MSAAQEHVAELRLARDSRGAGRQRSHGPRRRTGGAPSRCRRIAGANPVHGRGGESAREFPARPAGGRGCRKIAARAGERSHWLPSWWSGRASASRHKLREQELGIESEQLRARLGEIEVELKAAREVLDGVRDRRGELSAQAAKAASDTGHLVETCIQELSQSREELLADEALAHQTGEELAATEPSYREMRARLEGMGPVNMMALEEYQETAQRHEFLETQRKDLLDSIENTQNTIKEIEEISRGKFNEAFAIINANFTRTFKKLFGGGEAWMKLTDEENSAESGIDIVASPPGKKMQNVLLLSGGEKAMTALSLLVGIFQFAPAPVLHPRRGGRAAGRSQRNPLRRADARDEHGNPVHHHHAPQENDEHGAGAVWRHHAGTRRVAHRQRALRQRARGPASGRHGLTEIGAIP